MYITKNKTVKRVLFSALALFMLSYVVFQIYTSAHNTLKTEYVSSYTFNDNIETKAFIVKEETVLDSIGSGTVNYLVNNGERVAKGAVVARAYSSEAQALSRTKADALQKKISQYEKLTAVGGNYLATEADKLKKRLSERLFDYLSITDGSDLSLLDDRAAELLSVMNENLIASGASSDFTAKIDQLKKEKESLEAAAGTPVSEITAPASGYYVNSIDSLEGEVSTDNINEISVETAENALSLKVTDGSSAAGKIITGYEWYFVSVLPASKAQMLSEGNRFSVFIPKISGSAIPVKVTAMNYNASSDKCAVVMECTYMSDSLSSLRNEDIEICAGTYTGLRVPSEAIRVVDGVTGVYVVSGITAKFKAVDILHTDKAFSVCKADNTNSSSLALYDEVILSGGDLYDGKVVK